MERGWEQGMKEGVEYSHAHNVVLSVSSVFVTQAVQNLFSYCLNNAKLSLFSAASVILIW